MSIDSGVGAVLKGMIVDEIINGFTGFAKKKADEPFKYTRDSDRPREDRRASFDPEKLELISKKDRRWSWVDIDLSAIRHNVLAAKRCLRKTTHLMAVVKADAYGHGAVQVAKTALNSGADYLAVATVQEGIELRMAMVNAPILILSQPPVQSIPLLLGYKIMPTIYEADFAICYAEAADKLGLLAPFHLAINTGMNRIGVHWDQAVEFMRKVTFHRALDLKGVFTHFATADCPESFHFNAQVRRFEDAVNAIRSAGFKTGLVHAANSAALFRYSEVHYDMARLGIAMYGLHPCPETREVADLRPAMSVHARITDTRVLALGEGVSYGLHYNPTTHERICTIPVGYADGLRRNLSGKTDFIYNGVRVPQVGNICMDQCMFSVDLRDRHRLDPQVGDEVVVVGQQGNSLITLDELADKLGTIHYELAIGFSQRMPRFYI